MATVWLKDKCPVCREPVKERGILLADVKLTAKDAYQSYKPSSGSGWVRPNFQAKKTRVVFHSDCLPEELRQHLK